MNQTLPIILAALLLGLLALGWLAYDSSGPAPLPTPTPTATTAVDPGAEPSGAGDLSLPEDEPERATVEAPGPAQVDEPVTPGPTTEAAPAAATSGPATLDELRLAVAATDQAARAQRLTERLPQAAADLGLSSAEQAELERAVLALYQGETGLDALWEETQDSDLVSAKKDGDWNEFQRTLEQLLSPEQLEAYGALDAWAFPGASGRGR